MGDPARRIRVTLSSDESVEVPGHWVYDGGVRLGYSKAEAARHERRRARWQWVHRLARRMGRLGHRRSAVEESEES